MKEKGGRLLRDIDLYFGYKIYSNFAIKFPLPKFC